MKSTVMCFHNWTKNKKKKNWYKDNNTHINMHIHMNGNGIVTEQNINMRSNRVSIALIHDVICSEIELDILLVQMQTHKEPLTRWLMDIHLLVEMASVKFYCNVMNEDSRGINHCRCMSKAFSSLNEETTAVGLRGNFFKTKYLTMDETSIDQFGE